jgi:hypothetical protein
MMDASTAYKASSEASKARTKRNLDGVMSTIEGAVSNAEFKCEHTLPENLSDRELIDVKGALTSWGYRIDANIGSKFALLISWGHLDETQGNR